MSASYSSEVLADLREFAADDLPHYSDCLTLAFGECEPVFTRPRYAEFFWHCAANVPGWLGQVVLANGDAESEGSRKLLNLWRSVTYNDRIDREVLAHARDEAGHSQLFITLANTCFADTCPDSVAAGHRARLTRIRSADLLKDPGSIDEGLLIDHLVQMNVGEIRTRLHMHLLGPAIYAFAPEANREMVEKILQGLAGDEVRHIGYTARLMEEWCRTGDKERIASLYRIRLREFHEITVQQTEGAVRSFGMGRFPDLLEI